MLPLALAACAPEVPESGVGFTAYGSAVNPRPVGSVAPTQPVFSTERLGAAIDAAEGRRPVAGRCRWRGRGIGGGGSDPNRPRGNEPTTIRPEIGEMVRPATISDEQDFDAVAARETIESDAERIARNRAQYTVIQPGAAGAAGRKRAEHRGICAGHEPSAGGASCIAGRRCGSPIRWWPVRAMALRTGRRRRFWRRAGPSGIADGLDPDGDGYACGWDPRPFRAVRDGAGAVASGFPSPNFGPRRGGVRPTWW
jgi:hypothetical protein